MSFNKPADFEVKYGKPTVSKLAFVIKRKKVN